MGKTVKQCKLTLFQDYDFTRDLEDAKSTSGGTYCAFLEVIHLSNQFGVSTQTSVSHSSIELEIISLDAGFRSDGLPALNSRDPICKVLNTIQNHDKTEQPVVDSDKNHEANKSNLEEFSMF